MTSAAGNIPDESHLLCEYCGYTLSGLPENGMCPECGREIAQSLPTLRKEPSWETGREGFRAFIDTTIMVLFRPTHFYRTLVTRASVQSARRFAWIHWIVTSVLFGLTAQRHAIWYHRNLSAGLNFDQWWMLPALVVLTFTALSTT